MALATAGIVFAGVYPLHTFWYLTFIAWPILPVVVFICIRFNRHLPFATFAFGWEREDDDRPARFANLVYLTMSVVLSGLVLIVML